MKILFISLILSVSFLSSAFAQEEQLPIFKQVGVGAESSVLKKLAPQFLVRMTWDIYKRGNRFEYQMWGLVRGQFSVGHDSGGFNVPYVDLDFVPLFWGLEPSDGLELGGRVIPIQYRRNIRLGQDYSVSVHAVGVEVINDPRRVPDADEAGTFYRIAIDAVNLKWVKYLQDLDNHFVWGFGAVQGEYGYYKGTDDFRMRVSFGGFVDVSQGSRKGHGFVVQSELVTYFKTAIDYKKFTEFYFQTGLNILNEFGVGIHEIEWQSILGVNFYF